MLENQKLHEYLCERTWDLTEQWYETLDKNKGGVYSSTDLEQINILKRQNHDFHVRFCSMFSKGQEDFSEDFQEWIEEIATDDAHLSTPIVVVIEEFFRTQQQYLEIIAEYVSRHEEEVSFDQLNRWNLAVVQAISKVILEFTAQNTRVAQERLHAQQQMIVEMSAPVILLTPSSGFLPLVGEITTHRAQTIFEKTLKQCAKHNLEKLVIDLSGVPIIDTMVAQQVFQLINGLKIIGVKAALSGISPVIAQTAVHLGIKFTDIEVYNSLAQALKQNGVQLVQ
jgi:rsbT co-antagonist protein RsbR